MLSTLPAELVYEVLALCDRQTLAESVRPACRRFQQLADRHFTMREALNVDVGLDSITVDGQPWPSDDSHMSTSRLRVDRVNVTFALATEVPSSAIEALFRHVAKCAFGAHLNIGVASTFKGQVRLPAVFDTLCVAAKSARVWPMAAGTITAIPLGRQFLPEVLSLELAKLDLKDVGTLAANADAVAEWLNAETPKKTAEYRYSHFMAPETVDAEAPALRELMLNLQHEDVSVFGAVQMRIVKKFLSDRSRRRFLLIVGQLPKFGRQTDRHEVYENEHTGETLIVDGRSIQRLVR